MYQVSCTKCEIPAFYIRGNTIKESRYNAKEVHPHPEIIDEYLTFVTYQNE